MLESTMKKTLLLLVLCFASGCAAGSLESRLRGVQRDGKAIEIVGVIVPGGEMVHFSQSMHEFMIYVKDHPDQVQAYLKTHLMTKEIAISLGLVPERWAVDVLIENIPTEGVRLSKTKSGMPPPTNLTDYQDDTTLFYYCIIHSLTYVTGQTMGRTRYGTYYTTDMKSQWQKWWTEARDEFNFDAVDRHHRSEADRRC